MWIMKSSRRKRASNDENNLPSTSSAESQASFSSSSSPSDVALVQSKCIRTSGNDDDDVDDTGSFTDQTEFLDVNDDCIEVICGYLSLDDLCSLSRTCIRIQNIVGAYFQRYYPNNHVRIQSFRRRSVFYMYPDEKYVDDLKSFIRNVSIQEYKGSASVHYIKQNFGENLREIALHGINCELTDEHGQQIAEQLKRLESIKFVNCSIGDLYEIFLRRCKKLRHLGIDEPIQFNGRCTWSQHSFATLQSIAYFDEANTNRADFNGFLERNPQIKSIACKGANVHATVFKRTKNLDMLVLCFNSAKDFLRNFPALKLYSEQSQTQRIKLEFKKRLELEHFTKIFEIQRVYGYRGYLVENLQFPEMGSMEYLRVMQLTSFGNVSPGYVKRLANCLTHLEELHFAAVDMALSCKNLLLPFCQNSKFKKFVIYSKQIMYRCTRTDIIDYNRVRESFDVPSKLTIYMEKEVIRLVNFKIPHKCLVSLKPLSELERDTHSFDL